MPLHDILHACYMTPKTLEVLHVMACNLNVITCNYMHYMSLHAIEDANEFSQKLTPRGPTPLATSVCQRIFFHFCLTTV